MAVLNFLVQPQVFGEESEILIAELKRRNIPYNSSEKDLPVIPRGSVEFVESLSQPKLIDFTLDNYEYLRYSKHVENLLNDPFGTSPWGQLADDFWSIKKLFKGDRCFIRPNSGRKIFTGTTVGYKWFCKELETIESLPWNSITPDCEVIVSSYKEISAEYRCLMHKNTVIDYCLYEGEGPSEVEIPVLSWFPDDFYVMDLALCGGEVKILEVNAFCTAGWYDCSPEKILDYLEGVL